MNQKRTTKKRPRPSKGQAQATTLNRREQHAVVEETQSGLDEVDERMSEILGERQAHQVIPDSRLWNDNRQRGGE